MALPSGVAIDLTLSCVCGTSSGLAALPGPALGAASTVSAPTGRPRSSAKVAWAFKTGSGWLQGIRAAVRKVDMVISIWAHDRVWASLQL